MSKTLKEMINDLRTTTLKAEAIDTMMKMGAKGDQLYDIIGKDYMNSLSKNDGIAKKTNREHPLGWPKPITEIVTIPGTVGVKFDTWINAGWDCANCIEDKYPNGQETALEAILGYNKYGSVTDEMRNLTIDQLGPKRLRLFSMLEGKFARRNIR
jgi:hypothetical protein